MKLSEATDILRKAGIEDPRAEARLLFTEIGGIPEYKTVGADPEVNSPILTDAVRRREKREPMGYILGSVGFYHESYFVTPDTLIPRSDTEALVEYAVSKLGAGDVFLDLCTGSGCIAISVLKNTFGTTAVAVDISEKALRVAAKNSDRNGVSDRLTLLYSDVTAEPDPTLPHKVNAILANPPYVTVEEYGELEKEIYFEPKSAFVGGDDGGDFYRAITSKYKGLLADGGFIAYEIGYRQAELIRAIAESENMSCRIIHDLGANPRVAILENR